MKAGMSFPSFVISHGFISENTKQVMKKCNIFGVYIKMCWMNLV
jgi:hypothetical protein